MVSLHVHSKSDQRGNKQKKIEHLSYKKYLLTIVPCFAIKQLKYNRNKGILSIQVMGKCIFALFQKFFPFYWKAKLVSCVILLTVLKLVVHLGSVKHTYISMVKQTISTS